MIHKAEQVLRVQTVIMAENSGESSCFLSHSSNRPDEKS